MAKFSVFGSSGFIGSTLVRDLEKRGATVRRITRQSWPESGEALGHVIFTIGMTAGFRQRLTETVEMQVVRLHDALTRYRFDSFLYLSSTRVYAGASNTSEDAELTIRPTDPDHIYNISKLAGEALCLAQASPAIRVARLSNVFGGLRADTFLGSVLSEASTTGSVMIGQSPSSEKDYIHVDDVAERLIEIALRGRSRIYNVGSGWNTSHGEIAAALEKYGVKVRFAESAPPIRFQPIDCRRAKAEFGEVFGKLDSYICSVLTEPAPEQDCA